MAENPFEGCATVEPEVDELRALALVLRAGLDADPNISLKHRRAAETLADVLTVETAVRFQFGDSSLHNHVALRRAFRRVADTESTP